MTLAKWMDQVYEACGTEREMLIHGLPEAHFYIAYSHGSSPGEFLARHERQVEDPSMKLDQAST